MDSEQNSTPIVWIDEEACKKCGICVLSCVRQIIILAEQTAKVTNLERCCLCGHCSAVCPENAVHIPSLDHIGFDNIPSKEDLPTPEQLLNLIRKRRSIRAFRRQAISGINLERVLNAGRFAPSGSNRQPLQYLVRSLQGEHNQILSLTRQALGVYENHIGNLEKNSDQNEHLPLEDQATFSYQKTFHEVVNAFDNGKDRIYWQAPTLIICHLKPLASAFPYIDAGVAVMQMLLMADTLGLGTCICGLATIAIQNSMELRAALGVPEGNIVPICFVIGHPAIRYRKLIPRKQLDVHIE